MGKRSRTLKWHASNHITLLAHLITHKRSIIYTKTSVEHAIWREWVSEKKKIRKSEDLFSYIIIVIECFRSIATHREYKISKVHTHTLYHDMLCYAMRVHALTCERLWCVGNIKCHIKFRTINFNHQRTNKTKPLTKNYNSYGSVRTHARTAGQKWMIAM